MVFFEAPHRLVRTLTAMAEVLGPDRRAAVCRELTKTYEEVRRGSLAELATWAEDGVRGEITVVVGGARAPSADLATEVARVLERVAAGERLKEACAEVSRASGLSKKVLYDSALEFRARLTGGAGPATSGVEPGRHTGG